MGGNALSSNIGNISCNFISIFKCSYIINPSGDSTFNLYLGKFILININISNCYGKMGGSIGDFDTSLESSTFQYINCIYNNEYCAIQALRNEINFQFSNIIYCNFTHYLLTCYSSIILQNCTFYQNSKNIFFNNGYLYDCIGDFSLITLIPSLITQYNSNIPNDQCILLININNNNSLLYKKRLFNLLTFCLINNFIFF